MSTSPLEGILESVARIVPADLAAILAMTADGRLRVLASAGSLATPKLREMSIDLNQRPVLRAALEKNQPTVMHSEPGEEIDEPDTYEGAVALPGDHSCLVAPLRHQDELEGLLTVDVAVCRAFDSQQVAAIGALADLAARLIHEEQRADALSKDLDQLVLWRAGLKEDGEAGASLIGSSPVWLRVVERARLAAPTNATVLITGETGTGKEQVARAIHQWSLRAGGPFVALNCSAVVPELASSELFGHERGAFTGADRRREGRFALAEKGTLFLDEVADLPPGAQAQLLRVIQERVYERVGGAGTLLRADVRLIGATHKDLWQEVAEGRFREDLYFRLSTYPLELPPLRERVSDIPLLASHLLKRIGKELGIPALAISPAAIRLLEGPQWLGNIRELRNALERAVILARGQTIQPKHFDFPSKANRTEPEPAPMAEPATPECVNRLDSAIAAEVLRALREADGKIAGVGGAAQRLGVPPTTLHSLMKRLRLNRSRYVR
ncbi:MAG: sigma 54-interacting transcriptional regulator [Bryobacteraceae bacterium]|nr:sigma 54-interacting transcriptional regulator [Bryobacteraceae bacterium]